MARYFFNVRDSIDINDSSGTELPNLTAAKRQALKVLGSFFQVADYEPATGHWRLEVKDESGQLVFVLRPVFSIM